MVEVDRLGQAQRVAPANTDYQPTDAQIAYHLARFIEDVRGLPADAIVLRQNWLRAYDFTTDRGAAALNDYARTNDPFAKLGKVQVSVEVSSVIRASPESFRVAWVQRTYDNGSLSSTERWTAILSVVIETPRDAERLRKNPLGVYVHAINWSKELGSVNQNDVAIWLLRSRAFHAAAPVSSRSDGLAFERRYFQPCCFALPLLGGCATFMPPEISYDS